MDISTFSSKIGSAIPLFKVVKLLRIIAKSKGRRIPGGAEFLGRLNVVKRKFPDAFKKFASESDVTKTMFTRVSNFAISKRKSYHVLKSFTVGSLIWISLEEVLDTLNLDLSVSVDDNDADTLSNVLDNLGQVWNGLDEEDKISFVAGLLAMGVTSVLNGRKSLLIKFSQLSSKQFSLVSGVKFLGSISIQRSTKKFFNSVSKIAYKAKKASFTQGSKTTQLLIAGMKDKPKTSIAIGTLAIGTLMVGVGDDTIPNVSPDSDSASAGGNASDDDVSETFNSDSGDGPMLLSNLWSKFDDLGELEFSGVVYKPSSLFSYFTSLYFNALTDDVYSSYQLNLEYGVSDPMIFIRSNECLRLICLTSNDSDLTIDVVKKQISNYQRIIQDHVSDDVNGVAGEVAAVDGNFSNSFNNKFKTSY